MEIGHEICGVEITVDGKKWDWYCSLPPGHTGNHIAYEDHDLGGIKIGESISSSPEEPEGNRHMAMHIYKGRASYDFIKSGEFQTDGFAVTVAGHTIAECEDSEVADWICKQWNAQKQPNEFTHFRCLSCGFNGTITLDEIAKHRSRCAHGPTVAERGSPSVGDSAASSAPKPTQPELIEKMAEALTDLLHVAVDKWPANRSYVDSCGAKARAVLAEYDALQSRGK